jgi:hypothetical protein
MARSVLESTQFHKNVMGPPLAQDAMIQFVCTALGCPVRFIVSDSSIERVRADVQSPLVLQDTGQEVSHVIDLLTD